MATICPRSYGVATFCRRVLTGSLASAAALPLPAVSIAGSFQQVILGGAACGLGLAMAMAALFTPPLATNHVPQLQLVYVPAARATDLAPRRGTALASEVPAVQPVVFPFSTWRCARMPSVDTSDATHKTHHRHGAAQSPQGRMDEGVDLRSDLLELAAAQRRVTLDWSPGHYAEPTLDPVTMWGLRWFMD
jgi:hypothetical protein